MPRSFSSDDHPSPEDLNRFSDDSGYCPECGAEVWDFAPTCKACGAWIEGNVQRHPPAEREIHGRVRGVIIIVTLVAFLAALGLLRFLL